MSDILTDIIMFVGKLALFIGLPAFGIVKCSDSDWYKEHQRQQAIQTKAEETPHVIREADGCKVYQFRSGGSWHFFTRCGDTVTTERTYSESCGKNCTKQKSEVIVTRGNQ